MQKFSEEAWEATAQIRARINELPLLVELADGSLDPHRFVEYIVQDDFYLRGYSRTLATLGTRAPTGEQTGFWVTSSCTAVAAEAGMHAALLADPRLAGLPRSATASPTTRAYSNMLQTAAAYEPYAVGVAAALPCFWVYAHVGEQLTEKASAISDHPYGHWVATYSDPGFQQSTRTAIAIADAAAENASPDVRHAMLTAFVDATWYEEQFWSRSYELERWNTD